MRKKILVVDDNAELLEELRTSFQRAGFAVATATNGVDALKKVRTIAPDLVLLDLRLPELDGVAVCETLREDPLTASVPVFLLSDSHCCFTRADALDSGGTDLILKPASPTEVVSRIQRFFAEQLPLPACDRN